MIGIISTASDLHARFFVHQLGRAWPDERVAIFDLGDFGRGGRLAYSSSSSARSRALTTIDGDLVELDQLTAVWYRRIGTPTPDRAVRARGDVDFARQEWRHSINGLLDGIDAFFISEPRLQEVSKLVQLDAAQRAGLAVPRTLVTNDRDRAVAFVESLQGAVVHKPMVAPPDRVLATQRWDDRAAAALDDLALAPTMFQEAIAGDVELRITYVDGRCFTGAFTPTHDYAEVLDSRLTLDPSRWRAGALPSAVTAGIDTMMRELGLLYGTIDMKITPAGEHVFFEVNPQGQYLYVEILTGLPITAAMIDLLRQRRPRARARACA